MSVLKNFLRKEIKPASDSKEYLSDYVSFI